MLHRLNLGLCILALSSTAAQAQVSATQGTRDYPLTKGDNPTIGLPFNTVTGSFIGSEPCIQGFTSEKQKSSTSDRFTSRLMQVSDSLGLMRTLNINVSASSKVFGLGVSGKMGFAGGTNLNQTNLNYAFYAQKDGPTTQMEAKEGETIRLTKAARNLLKNKGENAFREKCGDSYVRANYTGAEGFAILTLTTKDQTTRDKITASINVDGAAWKASGSMDTEMKEQSSSKNLRIIYSQIGGGSGNNAESTADDQNSDWEKLKTNLESLRKTEDTVPVGYQVQSYNVLISVEKLKLKPSPDLLLLAYYRASYETLSDTLEQIKSEGAAAEFSHVLGRNQNGGAGDAVSISKLSRAISDDIATTKKLYDACNNWKPKAPPAKCADTQTLATSLTSGLTDPFIYMSRLPLHMASQSSPVEAFYSKPDLVTAILRQYHFPAADGYCQIQRELELLHPGCKDYAQVRSEYGPELDAVITDHFYPTEGGYEVNSLYRRDKNCLKSFHKSGSNKNLTVSACDSTDLPTRFYYEASGQLRVRKGQCPAGSETEGGKIGPRDCDSLENQQLWRFIPLDRKEDSSNDGTAGLLQEAGFGRCMTVSDEDGNDGKYAVTQPCDASNEKQHWSFETKK